MAFVGVESELTCQVFDCKKSGDVRMSIQPSALRFNFVLPTHRTGELEQLRKADPETDANLFDGGEKNWCLQTYLELARDNWPVILSEQPIQGCVNLFHPGNVFRMKAPAKCFFVSVQADYRRIPWADAHVVQNQRQADGKTSFWMMHWPQPALIAREAGRGTVRCAAFPGNVTQLAGSPAIWRSQLAPHGVAFKLLDRSSWHDYSNVDVLVAVRSFDKATHDSKPGSKLLNAWLGRVPIIAGYDSAFDQIGRPGIDYIRVDSIHGAVEAILRLRDDPAYYASVVAAGWERAAAFSRDSLREGWQRLLGGPISSLYHAWMSSGSHRPLSWRAYVPVWQIGKSLRYAAKGCWRDCRFES